MKLSHLTTSLVIAAILLPATIANAAGGPTQARVQKRQAQNTAQYHQCAGFALRVLKAGLSQAGNNSAKVRAARSHYQANLGRCRARYL